MQNFRAGSVQFIQEEDDRFAVHREPVGWSEVCLCSDVALLVLGFHLGRKTDDITRIRHLSEKQGYYLEAFLLIVVCQDLRLANTMFSYEHDIV